MILDKEPLLQGVMVSGLKTVPHRGVSIHMTIFIYVYRGALSEGSE